MSKTILITGTSTGVGFESAILFAQQGYKVYATMRNLAKANALQKRIEEDNLNIEILELDVTKTETIEKVVNTIIEKDGKIDVLLNNAGAGFAKTTELANMEEVEWVTDVNYHGVVRCTKAVLPYMRKARSGRIISVTSVGGLVGQPFNEFYCAAKFAVEGYMEALATYVSEFNIKFSIIEPGGISTEFFNSAVKVTSDAEGKLATGEYEPLINRYFAGTQKRAKESTMQVHQTGKEVAEVIAEVANSENPPLRKRTSKWAEDLCELKTGMDSDGLKLQQKVKTEFLGE